MSVIVFDKVTKEYGDTIVLEDISIDIAPGTFLALVGPSGCGKTTFLRMLLGEEVPSRGSILIDGVPLKAEPDADRGVVFQRYSVFPHLTVLGNVMIGREFEQSRIFGRLLGSQRNAAKKEAEELIASVGLAGHEDKYPTSLSGGMRQRLALAQALMMKPRILLLDEPFGALDPGIRSDIHALMQSLWNERGMSVVMVTHDLSEAFRLGTRVIALERKRKRPEEAERYGASIEQDIEVWPRKISQAVDSDRVSMVAPQMAGAN